MLLVFGFLLGRGSLFLGLLLRLGLRLLLRLGLGLFLLLGFRLLLLLRFDLLLLRLDLALLLLGLGLRGFRLAAALGLLPGVLRRSLIEAGEAIEGEVRIADLADGFLLGNAVRGLAEARLLA